MPPVSNYPFPPRLIFFTTRAKFGGGPITTAAEHFRIHFSDAKVRLEVGPAVTIVETAEGVAVYGAPYPAPDWLTNQREGEQIVILYVDRLEASLEGANQ